MKKGYHHARYLEPKMYYHIVSKTRKGKLYFRPDSKKKLQLIFRGIIYKAKLLYPEVSIFAYVLLSNHMHLEIATTNSMAGSRFIRYIKVEVTRRWQKEVGLSGPLWEGKPFKSTALPDKESRIKCFKYILSHGVKEGLVKKSTDWPGPHASHFWFNGRKSLKGIMINGTKIAKAKAKNKILNPYEYTKNCNLILDNPKDLNLTDEKLKILEYEIIQEAKRKRKDKSVLGLKSIFKQKRHKKKILPQLNFLFRKGTYVAWAKITSPKVKDYLARYFSFQQMFREASDLFLQNIPAIFPDHCWKPSFFKN